MIDFYYSRKPLKPWFHFINYFHLQRPEIQTHSNSQKSADPPLPCSTVRVNYSLQILEFHNIKSLALIVIGAPGVSRATKALQLTITDTMDDKSSTFDWASKSRGNKKEGKQQQNKKKPVCGVYLGDIH